MVKRKRSECSVQLAPAKKSKTIDASNAGPRSQNNINVRQVLQPLLHKCYRDVKTLQSYILDRLPSNSRLRKKQLATFDQQSLEHHQILNNTLVGILKDVVSDTGPSRLKELSQFTQAQRSSESRSASTQKCTLDEVVDFVIWFLFKNRTQQQKKPSHILCHGLEYSVTNSMWDLARCKPVLPGVLQRHANMYVKTLKQPPWRQLMALCGADGEAIFLHLLLDCGIFVPVHEYSKSYCQLSGVPVHELCKSQNGVAIHHRGLNKIQDSSPIVPPIRRSSDIRLVRNRMFYSKPSLNRDKEVSFGLKHLHILNRNCDLESVTQDVIVLQYIFPRQFDLHNVFTSLVDRRETAQSLKDYTFREAVLGEAGACDQRHIPPRLRGDVLRLVRQLRRRHKKCSFDQLISHYCPVRHCSTNVTVQWLTRQRKESEIWPVSKDLQTQLSKTSFRIPNSPEENLGQTDHIDSSFFPYSSSTDQVSSFCRAALRGLIPRWAFGLGDDGSQNLSKILADIDKFIKMRKFETTSMHELMQGLKLKAITWLAPEASKEGANLALTDKKKREELLGEFIYYIFDSLLIPLISANFYVTESGIHRNKLLYFRHDVWGRLCQPSLASARLNTLVSVSSKHIRHRPGGNQLGYSLMRLMPKDVGTRSITNLRRRTIQSTNGKRFLGPSINSRLTPIFNIFNYERQHDNGIFKASTLSMQDIGCKLASFKAQFNDSELLPLYFAKVDIQSAFDSIPQQKLLDLVGRLFKHDQYFISRHAVSKMITDNQTSVKFVRAACSTLDMAETNILPPNRVSTGRYAIYSDTDQYQTILAEHAAQLLKDHVQSNIIKIGKKYFKQTEGIPQGSILSSLLCTFFYNHFEKSKLNFLGTDSSLLLRIIDDFLLITTERAEAMRFVEAMKTGDSSYGILVHAEKSLVNFDIAIDGVQVPKLTESTLFPYCGLLINTKTLEVSKDRVRKDNTIANTLTVDLHGHVGEKLKRRLVSSLRIQLQGIVLSTTLNERARILRTLVECFQETAMKLHQYYIHIPRTKRPSPKLVIDLVEHLIDLVFQTTKDRLQEKRIGLSRRQIGCLVAVGFLRVLTTRATLYPHIIAWLHEFRVKTEHSLNMTAGALRRLADASFQSVQHYVY